MVHFSTQTLVDFTLSTLFFFMSLFASSYIVYKYDMTANTFNGICVFCKVKRVKVILFRCNSNSVIYNDIVIRIFRQDDTRFVVTFIRAWLSKIKYSYWHYVIKNSLINALQFIEESRDFSVTSRAYFSVPRPKRKALDEYTKEHLVQCLKWYALYYHISRGLCENDFLTICKLYEKYITSQNICKS